MKSGSSAPARHPSKKGLFAKRKGLLSSENAVTDLLANVPERLGCSWVVSHSHDVTAASGSPSRRLPLQTRQPPGSVSRCGAHRKKVLQATGHPKRFDQVLQVAKTLKRKI